MIRESDAYYKKIDNLTVIKMLSPQNVPVRPDLSRAELASGSQDADLGSTGRCLLIFP
jgi:hypothetical protein